MRKKREREKLKEIHGRFSSPSSFSSPFSLEETNRLLFLKCKRISSPLPCPLDVKEGEIIHIPQEKASFSGIYL
jgi:hypothetical protein